MRNSNTFLLESKLKRLKISFSKENGKIIIGKSKTDFVILIGLIILPIVLGLAAIIFSVLSSFEFSGRAEGKILTISIGFLIFGIVNIVRTLSKKKANKNKKILDHKVIKIVEDEQVQRFEASNVKDFEYIINQLDTELYQGKLFLIDTNSQQHLLLGFDEENEQYLLDDLHWFIDYFRKHLELQTS